jgi:hypothetical protein
MIMEFFKRRKLKKEMKKLKENVEVAFTLLEELYPENTTLLEMMKDLYFLCIDNEKWGIENWRIRKTDINRVYRAQKDFSNIITTSKFNGYVTEIKEKTDVVDYLVEEYSELSEEIEELKSEILDLKSKASLSETEYKALKARLVPTWMGEPLYGDKDHNERIMAEARTKAREGLSLYNEVNAKLQIAVSKEKKRFQKLKEYYASVSEIRNLIPKYVNSVVDELISKAKQKEETPEPRKILSFIHP